MPKVRADQIAHALHRRHRANGDFFVTQCKSGPTTIARRGELFVFDALAVKKSWTRPCTTIYEIKVDRQDFLADEKWPAYRQYCNKFLFASPPGVINADEVSGGVGLIHYNPETKGLRIVRKPLFMDMPLPAQVYLYIIMNRLEEDRHPFFTDTREYCEALVADRVERGRLGAAVHSKLMNRLDRMAMDLKSIGLYKESHETLDQIKAVLSDAGHYGYGKELMEIVKELLAGGAVSPRAVAGLEPERELQALKGYLGVK